MRRDLNPENKRNLTMATKKTAKKSTTKSTKTTKPAPERAVVVCTSARGVFFGYTKDTSGETIKLRGGRNAYQWGTTEGIGQLGSTGPGPNARIGAPCDVEVRGITAVFACSDAAVAAWEKATWKR